MRKKAPSAQPIFVVTDTSIDGDGSLGSALAVKQKHARGAGKRGWKNFADAVSH